MHLYVDVSPLCHAKAHEMDEAELRGGPVQVALKVASMMAQFIRFYKATRIYFCMDHSVGNWRKQVCPTYKAGRDENKTEKELLIRQIASEAANEVFPELVALLEVPTFQMEYVEADDWCAACVAINEGQPGYIVTSDKDFWQLIKANVPLLNPIHNYRVELGPDGLLQKVKGDRSVHPIGLTPPQYLLMKAIWGDTSDNLPGLCNIGEKGATDAIKAGRQRELLTEQTKQVKPRKSKKNPNPVPYHQDAKAVVQHNIRMMALTKNEVSDKVQAKALEIQAGGVRQRRNNYSKLVLWLESKGISNDEIAKQLVATYTEQWLS